MKKITKNSIILISRLFINVALLPVILLLIALNFSRAQTDNEVVINVQVLPPYSNNIYEYIGADQKISRSFQEQILVTLRNTNPNRAYEVKLIASVLGNNGVEARMNENYQPFQRIILPAGEMRIISGRELAEINRNLTENDITSQGINSQQIRRTGTLPEGSYRICFRAFDFRTGQALSTNQPFGCSPPINISNPDPPVIAYPFNDAVVLTTNPQNLNISWAPVPNADPRLRYRIKIVELSEINANPYDLMEQSNVAFYQEDNIMINSIFYDQTKPQLKEGYTYAIRIQAYDPIGQIRIKNNGLSEINSFRYATSFDDGSGLSDMDYISLVPGYLQLTNLQQLSRTQTAGAERFNGQAQLKMINPTTATEELFNVQVNNLSLETGNRQSPTFLSGSLSGSLNEVPNLMQNLDGLVSPSAINWNYQVGTVLNGEVSLQDGTKVPVSGQVQLTPVGAIGLLKAGGQQKTIYELDTEEVKLKITEVIAAFPDNTIKGNGYLEVLKQKADSLNNGPCEVTDIDLMQDQVAINVNCSYEASIPLVPESNKVMLNFKSINGIVVANWSSAKLDYVVQALGVVDIKSDDDTQNCGIAMALNLENNKSPTFNVLGNNCALLDRSLSLGLVQLNLRDIMLTEISYLGGQWDFELKMNGDFIIPMFDFWTSPEVKDIIIDKKGITISAQDWKLGDLNGLQNIGWDSTVTLSPQQIKFDAITYPWYQQIDNGKEPWNFVSLGKADVRNLPVIPCLSDYDYDYRLYYNDQDGIFGEITGEGDGCSYDFGLQSSLALTKLKGTLFADFKEQKIIEKANLALTGNLKNEFLFRCQDYPDLDNVFLELDQDFVRGSIKQFVPECPINIGPFKAEITSSTLEFELRDGRQEVILDASADLIMHDSTKVKGTFKYDLVAGKFLDIEFRLDDPFTWNIPANEPVMSFYIEEAVINKEGFMIDGRNTLKLPEGKDINATFDKVLLDFSSMKIKNGQIIFDESFAFEAGIDTSTYNLNFKAVQTDSNLSLNPALYFALGTNVIIDSTGLKTGGDAMAKLTLGTQSFTDDLTVEFSEDFAIGLYPFKVSLGRADFLVKDQLIAFINDQGLSIDPTDFIVNALPDKIPLPDNNLAYLRIRDIAGELLIDVTKLPNGNVQIETKPGKDISFHLAAVNPLNPPVYGNVQLDAVELQADLQSPKIVSGTVTVNVPDNNPALSSLELPVKINQIAYGTNLFGSNLEGLFLSGDLSLFGTDLPEAGNTFLYVERDGLARATFVLSNTDITIPLVPNSNLVTYQLNSLQGNFAGYLNDLSAQNFSLDVGGQFSVNDQQTAVATADLDLHLEPGSFQITHFESSLNENPIDLDFGDFGLMIKDIPAIPVFNYTGINGFDFAASLNLELYINLAGGKRFELPLNGLEIRNTGLHIPQQNINPSSIPGLQIPRINLAGFQLELLAFRTAQPIVFNWYNQSVWDFNPSIDVAVRMPEIAARGLNLPDGLSFYNLNLDNGIFSGTMSPFEPPGGLSISLDNLPDAPKFNVSKITGNLLPDSITGLQDFNFEMEGKLSDLPGFKNPNVQACVDPEFSLSIKEGRAFEGTISNFTPCGSLELGPFSLNPQSSTLLFAYQNGVQEVSLDGTVRLDLSDTPSPNGLAGGNLKLNLLTGKMMNGFVEINKSFPFGLPVEDPFFNFNLTEARLDTSGFTMRGNGSLAVGNVNNNVIFNDLKLGLNDLKIKSGSANLGSNLNLDLNLNPFGLSISDFNAPKPAADHLRMALDADVMINKDGLSYSGTSVGSIRFAGQDFPALRAEFLESFALNINTFNVGRGKVEFYLDQNGQQAAAPLAILDQNGFSMGGGIVAALPDTLALPTTEVAYIILKDSQGNSLVNASQNTANGWDISTKTNEPLTLVVPALANGQSTPQTEVSFSLTTDSYYNPNGGSITLNTSIDLASYLDLPIEITDFALITDDRTALSASVKVLVPESLSDEDITADFIVDRQGFQEAILKWGTYSESYNPSLTPVITQDFQETLPNDNRPTNAALHVYGIEASLGNTKSLKLSGGFKTDLLIKENESPKPLFFFANYNNQSWSGGVDATHFTDGIHIGDLILRPEPQQPFALEITEDRFVIKADGIIDFEALVGEPLAVSIEDLAIGIDYSQNNPTIIFGLGGGGITLADQQLNLFDGQVSILLSSPTFSISGREITLGADGSLDIFEENVSFSDLRVSSVTGFSLGEVAMQSDIVLVQNYATLKRLSLLQNQQQLKLEAEIAVNLPEPVESTSMAVVSISREANNQVVIDVEGPDFELNKRIPIGEVAEFELTKIAVDISPANMDDFGIYATGKLFIEDQPRIFFGNDAAIRTNPGIAFTNRQLRYNATGNATFELDEGFFNIQIDANMSVSNASSFEIKLGGTAGVTIAGVGGSLDYENFTIGPNGIIDRGNLKGSGSLALMGFASLTIGQFQYEVPKDGASTVMVDLPVENEDPGSFDSKENTEVQFVATEVKRFLRFGGNGRSGLELTLGGENSAEDKSGNFSGGVDEIIFYELPNGNKYLKIDNANLKIGETLECNAFLQYQQTNSGFELQVTASAQVGLAGNSVAAALAGYFAKANNDLRFGLFVGISTSTGVPLFPGVVTLTGGGAGFFYQPTRCDLNLVIKPNGPLEALGHKMVRNQLKNPFNPPALAEIKFAVMLFAEVGILGQAGQYSLKGSTFIQITNKSVYFDAYGTVLGLDGEGVTELKLQGGAYVQASFDNFFIDGGGFVDLNMPVVLEGRMELVFFFAENPNVENEVIWAIDGRLDLTVYSILNMDGTIIACPSGIFMEAGVGVGIDKGILTIAAKFNGSVWFVDDDSFQYPFGAYLSAGVELKVLGVTATPIAKAAFATLRGGGFELVIGAEACASIPFKGEVCAHALASIKSGNGFTVQKGFGKMKSDLFNEAEGMKEAFETMINDLRNEINGAKDAVENFTPEVPELEIPTEVLAAAGFRFHTNPVSRVLGTFAIDANINQLINPLLSPLPTNLNWVRDNILISDPNISSFPMLRLSKYGSVYDQVKDRKQEMLNAMDSSALYLEEAIVRMTQATGAAYEFKEEAEGTFEELMTAMQDSPVQNKNLTINKDSEGKIVASPTFTIDEGKATAQNEKSAEAEGFNDKMKAEFELAIAATEQNLKELDALLTKPLEKSQNTNSTNGNTLQTSNNEGYTFMSSSVYSLPANVSSNNTNSLNYSALSLADYYPSVSDVTAGLRDAVEAIEQYYAYEGSFRARQYYWMNYALNELKSRETSIKNSLGSIYNSTNASQTLLENSMKDRINTIYILSGASQQEANTAKNNKGFSQNNFNESLENLWYDIHELGLEDTKNEIAFNTMVDLSKERGDALGLINTPYTALSNKIDEAYILKSEIVGLLHGLYQQYDKVVLDTDSSYSNIGAGSIKDEVSDRLAAIESDLAPPVINSILVDQQNVFFRNEATLSWTTNKSPIETSFQVQQTGDNTVATGYGAYKSIGNKPELTIHSYKSVIPSRSTSTPDDVAYSETKTFSVGFRLRSKAGITVLKRANFEVAVGPESPAQSSFSGNVKETDNTPPSISYLTFYPYDKEPQPDINNPFLQNYYTDEKESFYLEVGARDDESDIVKFEYAVGSSTGLRDIKEWSVLTGDRVRNTHNNPFGYLNEPNKILISELIGRVNSITLEEGERYFFSVRVTNGEGLTKTSSLGIPLAYDPTPPSDPIGRLALSGSVYGFTWGNTNVFPIRYREVATSTPNYQPLTENFEQLLNRIDQNPNRPQIDFKWTPSIDRESGIKGYEYYISKDSTIQTDEFVGSVDTETTSESRRARDNGSIAISDNEPMVSNYKNGVIKDYGDHYIFVKAYNNADNSSGISRIGPFSATDPTKPDLPDMQVTERSNALRIHIIKNSLDPESDLKGYQYALGTSANSANLRNFASAASVDWEFSNYDAVFRGVNINFSLSGGSSGPTQPTFDIDKADLPRGESIYVFFRAVSQQNMTSGIVACGPIYLDDTPPPTPSLSVTSGYMGGINMDLTDVNDPESGISKVIYKLSWTDNGVSKSSGYLTAFEPSTAVRTSQSLDLFYAPGSYDEGSVKVDVKVYNGRGAFTHTSKTLMQYIQLSPNSFTPIQLIGAW